MDLSISKCGGPTVTGTTGGSALCATGTADRTKVICDNKDYACGVDKPRTYKLTCADVEDEPTLWSGYKYIC